MSTHCRAIGNDDLWWDFLPLSMKMIEAHLHGTEMPTQDTPEEWLSEAWHDFEEETQKA